MTVLDEIIGAWRELAEQEARRERDDARKHRVPSSETTFSAEMVRIDNQEREWRRRLSGWREPPGGLTAGEARLLASMSFPPGAR